MILENLLNIELPIIQAPMAGVQGSELTIAVSNAGGLGSLPCGMLSLEAMGLELERIKAATDRPFNVNFFCHKQPSPSESREAQWRRLLSPYYKEFGLDPTNIPEGAQRLPFSQSAADLLEEYKPAVVSFHFGLPSKRLVEQVKGWGAKVLSSATTVDEALWLEANGADCIIAQGLEAGGHRGMFLTADLSSQMGTFALLPQICDAVNIPVVAAGGIVDAQSVVAAMSMGAAGVQVGTAYMLCPEAKTSAVHRAALKSDRGHHTAVTNLFSGRPARGIVNRLIQELGPINDHVVEFPLASSAIGPLRAAGEAAGYGDFSPLWAGQNVSGCKDISATALTRSLFQAP